MKTTHKSPSLKFIIFCVLAITVILSIVYAVMYFNAKDIIERQLGTSAQSVAVSVSLEIMENIDEYKVFLETKDIHSDYYKKKQQMFDKIKKESNIRFIFTEQRIDSETIEFILDSEPIGSAEYSPPGSTGPNDWKRETVYGSGQPEKFRVYNHPQWGKIIAAYAPLFDENNEIIGIVGVNIDVTELIDQLLGMFGIMIATYIIIIVIATVLLIRFSGKIIELASSLSRSQESAKQSAISFSMFKALLDALDTYLFVSELETDEIIFVNAKMKERFHFSDDAIGRLCRDVMNTCMGDRCEFCVKLELLSNPDEAESMDMHVVIQGQHYKKSDRIINWYDGRKVHLQYFIDITELKQTEAALEEQLAQLQRMSALINAAPQYIAYVNPTGKFDFINPAICHLSGYSYDELMDNGLNILYDSQTKQRLSDEIIPAINTHGKYEYEIPLTRKDGQVRIMSFSSFAVQSENDRHGCIATDITDKKLLEQELIAAKEAAENASQAKSNFLSQMSHEIRTPINAIIGMTQIAHNSGELEKVRYCLDKVDVASKHLLGVINDILDMSKIEADKFELSYDVFNFNRMLESIFNIISFRMESKQQSFSTHIGEDVPPYIIGDEQRLSQVIANLLSNAVKFTPDGGKIVLNVTKDDDKDGICTLRIEVEDSGIGISPEHQSRLFTAFGQASGSIARKYGGTGLGLAISKRIVEMMGGNIWVESVLGSGSRFIVNIQAEQGNGDMADMDRVDALSLNKDFSHHTILLAEDVEINSEILTAILEETGVTIDIAPNGLEAVKLFQQNPERYSLILMDIHMPEMDGYEATRAIRSTDCKRAITIPIVAMTADVFLEDVERCLAAGMNGHIGKPVDTNELFTKLSVYLR